MPRLPRIDRPGRLHHVMNRGLARRTVFETRRDVRFFLSLLARAVRAGQIEVVAFAILTTHFHLLVRSVDGRISESMRRILNAYVRWFNRSRRRDGPLFRGRFRSIPVESPRQFWYTVRYIDANPVEARLAGVPEEYPNGSARFHAGLARRPRWLDGTLVDCATQALVRQGAARAEAYRRAFEPRLPPGLRAFVAGRLRCVRRDAGAGADLVELSNARLDVWMRRRASLGDGTRAGIPFVAADALLAAVEERRRSGAPLPPVVASRTGPSVLHVLRAGLLRDLAGERVRDVARRLGQSGPTVSRLHEAHRRAVLGDAAYRCTALEVVRLALDRCDGSRPLEDALRPLFAGEREPPP